MKKSAIILLIIVLIFSLAACGTPDRYDLTEDTFFYLMTHLQLYPEQYLGKPFTFDCFTYRLTDTQGREYLCGVRQCSAGIGCKCGKDTIIGFILDYDGEIPEPRHQSDSSPDKSWIHLEGQLASAEKDAFDIYAYDAEGKINYDTTESIYFYHYTVESLTVIEDYSGLNYYVDK